MLRKPELSAGPMGHLGLYKGFTYETCWLKKKKKRKQTAISNYEKEWQIIALIYWFYGDHWWTKNQAEYVSICKMQNTRECTGISTFIKVTESPRLLQIPEGISLRGKMRIKWREGKWLTWNSLTVLKRYKVKRKRKKNRWQHHVVYWAATHWGWKTRANKIWETTEINLCSQSLRVKKVKKIYIFAAGKKNVNCTAFFFFFFFSGKLKHCGHTGNHFFSEMQWKDTQTS